MVGGSNLQRHGDFLNFVLNMAKEINFTKKLFVLHLLKMAYISDMQALLGLFIIVIAITSWSIVRLIKTRRIRRYEHTEIVKRKGREEAPDSLKKYVYVSSNIS